MTTLGIAMVGHAFMGAAHSQAWRVAPRFFDLPARPVMAVLCGRDPDRTRAAAVRLGWAESVTDWKSVLDRDDVHVVDICTPGDTHAEIAVAALDAGKHVLCEKPMANSVAEAVAMAEAADRAARRGVRAMVGFSYRRVPALGLARDLVAQGRLGRIRAGRRRGADCAGRPVPCRPGRHRARPVDLARAGIITGPARVRVARAI